MPPPPSSCRLPSPKPTPTTVRRHGRQFIPASRATGRKPPTPTSFSLGNHQCCSSFARFVSREKLALFGMLPWMLQGKIASDLCRTLPLVNEVSPTYDANTATPTFYQDPGKTGAPLANETIILEPTSPTTHFVFKPPPHNYVDCHGNVVVEAAPEGSGGKDSDRIRLDRFQHVPGSLVCRGNLGHVKVNTCL